MPQRNSSHGNQIIAEAGLITERTAQSVSSAILPSNTVLVSADNHIEVTEDIFHRSFPDRLRDAAPRVWFDRYWRVGYKDAMQTYPPGVDVDTALTRSVLNDGFTPDTRLQHLDTEGIVKEIVYPQSLLGFIRHPDLEVQELIYRIYNEHLADLGRRSPGQFYGVGICSNWWNPSKVESAVQHIVDLGLKSLMLPHSPGKSVTGEPLDYASPEMDRLWSAIAESGLPVNFHIGEVPSSGGRGGFGTFFLVQAAPFRRVFGNLIFGGILDRHPSLRIVFAEGGLNWVAGALQDAELTYGAHRDLYDWPMKHRPTDYWFNHCYATFQTDKVGLRLLDVIGADRIMWAQDYPHSEGTFGYSRAAIQDILDVTSEKDARNILGQTAIELYRLNER